MELVNGLRLNEFGKLPATQRNALVVVLAGALMTACGALGLLYQGGDGGAQDYAEGRKSYLQASERRGAQAQSDYAAARSWYLKAAEQGHAAAQNNLGALYYLGQGVTWDYVEARKWYLKAAEQGYAEAQNNLGALYHNADGVEQDYAMAYVWHNSAAARGHAAAGKNRDAVVAKLDAASLAEAQKLSKEYFKRYVEPFQETGPGE